jgi:RNA polymerase sigma factor (sigma-70 family)
MPGADSSEIASTLAKQRETFRRFIASRVGSEADADDLLQNGIVRALRAAGELKDEQKLVPWFYQILRNVIVDHMRTRSASRLREETWLAENAILANDPEAHSQICGCITKILPQLKELHAQLIRRVDLDGLPIAAAASEAGVTANHAGVILHRARRELRAKLTQYCHDCACLDDCGCD